MEAVKEKVSTFKELKVWQKAHLLVLEIYRITQEFPSEEKFGLISQLRRSATSIATNIVEGNRRKTRKDYLYFLNLADSSLEETKYHLMLSKDLNYIGEEKFDHTFTMCNEIGRMLFGLQRSLAS